MVTSCYIPFFSLPPAPVKLHHVTSHFFLLPAPLFPVKSPVPEMPKSPAVAQRRQSMALQGRRWTNQVTLFPLQLLRVVWPWASGFCFF